MKTVTDDQAANLRCNGGDESQRASTGRNDRISQAVDEFLTAADAGHADRAALLAKYHDVAGELTGCLDTFGKFSINQSMWRSARVT